mgnify:CR=1 FL=1
MNKIITTIKKSLLVKVLEYRKLITLMKPKKQWDDQGAIYPRKPESKNINPKTGMPYPFSDFTGSLNAQCACCGERSLYVVYGQECVGVDKDTGDEYTYIRLKAEVKDVDALLADKAEGIQHIINRGSDSNGVTAEINREEQQPAVSSLEIAEQHEARHNTQNRIGVLSTQDAAPVKIVQAPVDVPREIEDRTLLGGLPNSPENEVLIDFHKEYVAPAPYKASRPAKSHSSYKLTAATSS